VTATLKLDFYPLGLQIRSVVRVTATSSALGRITVNWRRILQPMTST